MVTYNIIEVKNLLKPRKVYNLFHSKPIEGFSIDSRTIEKGQGFIALKGVHHNGHEFIGEAIRKGAVLVIAERDSHFKGNVPYVVVENSYEALKKIVLCVRKKINPLVCAITGSVGKTTTKEMLAYLLCGNFTVLKNYKTENNILGVAKTFFSLKNQEVVVLELGTNAPGEIKTLTEVSRPDIGVIMFIKPVHLKGLGDLKGISEEKLSLLKANCRIKAVLNRDDHLLRKVNFCKNTSWFGKSEGSNLRAFLVRSNLKESIFRLNYDKDTFTLSLPTPFSAFIYNALAAMLSAALLGLPLKELVEKMKHFDNFGPSRMEIHESDDFILINDAYNANPYAFSETLKLIRKYPQRKIAVIGDMLELGTKSIYYHRLLAKHIIRSGFEYIITLGNFTPYLNSRLKELGYKNVIHCYSHNEVARVVKEKINEAVPPWRDVIELNPALSCFRRATLSRKGGVMKNYLLFLKGSRKMELEKVVALLEKWRIPNDECRMNA